MDEELILSEESEQPEDEAPEHGALYIGSGAFIAGIPARDLSKDEWKALAKGQRKHLEKIGLYKEV